MFPSVGLRRPVSWARASAVLDAKRSGKNPILQAYRVVNVEENQEIIEAATVGVKFIHRVDAIDEWRRVVRALKLEKKVEFTSWDFIVRKFKQRGNTERKCKKAVFEVSGEPACYN